MATAHATAAPTVHEDFVKRGDWTKERHEILEKLSNEEIDADILRLQGEYAETLTIKPVRWAGN